MSVPPDTLSPETSHFIVWIADTTEKIFLDYEIIVTVSQVPAVWRLYKAT